MKQIGSIYTIGFLIIVYFATAMVTHAQIITAPYWCSGYYSSQPCYGSGNYNYNYNYGYNNYPYYGDRTYATYPYWYYPYQSYQRPSCTITSYTNNSYWGYGYNQAVTLSWVSSNATGAYISPGVGSVSTFGTRVVYPNGYTTYTMTVYGPGGTNTCETTYYQSAQYYQPYYYYYYYPYNSGYQYYYSY